MTQLTPINCQQQLDVQQKTALLITKSGEIFEREFAQIPVLFDLSGKVAGMYRVKNKQRVIRFNPWIFSRYYEDSLATTVPHEVAHYIVDQLFDYRKLRPHGREWQAIMAALGADASVRHQYSLEGVPQRRMRRYAYQCGCTTHELSGQRHSKIQRGRAEYSCQLCGERLTPAALA